jgi:hypothetical protein
MSLLNANICLTCILKSRDSAVGIAAGYELDDQGVAARFPVGEELSLLHVWGPPSLLSNGYPGLFPQGVKRQGRESDHSPPISAEVKKT